MIASNRSKSLTIFGSTGSIGCSAIDVVKLNPESFQIFALIAGTNVRLLAQQANELSPCHVIILDESKLPELKSLLHNPKINIAAGISAIHDISQHKVDLFIAAIVGSACLDPLYKAICAGSNIALANKESLVAAGRLIMDGAKRNGVTITPIDSEHNAIFQAMTSKSDDEIRSITLTASGGPFLKRSIASLDTVTIDEACTHPNWQMGQKISIDSATMMNKGLELIEACYLFDLPEDKIDIIVHPQSIIHGMVNYIDGTSLAAMSYPDMKAAIAYALSYPESRITTHVKQLNLVQLGSLEFLELDHKRFPAINLARSAIKAGGIMPLIFNAVGEVAVAKFLHGKISFNQIFVDILENLELLSIDNFVPNSIADILATDKMIRSKI